MKRTDVQRMFEKFEQIEPMYWPKISMVLFYMIVQLRSAKKEIGSVLAARDAEGELVGDGTLITPTKKEFYEVMQKDGHVFLSKNQMELFDTFLDPPGRCFDEPQTQLDVAKVVDAVERKWTTSVVNTCKVNSA